VSSPHRMDWRAVVVGLLLAAVVMWFGSRDGTGTAGQGGAGAGAGADSDSESESESDSDSEAEAEAESGAAPAPASAPASASASASAPAPASAPASASAPAPASASAPAPTSRPRPLERPPRPPPQTPPPVSSLKRLIPNVTVEAHGERPWRGDVDLGPTIDRILEGRAFPSRNDGTVFQNRERRLPSRPGGYYREYVHPTAGVRGPGPQRIVRGEGGEWYYSPDHYQTFIPLHDPGGPNGPRGP
jgi:ribonuclease T1